MSQIFGNGLIPSDGLNGTAAPWALPNAGSGAFPSGSPAYIGYGPGSTDAYRPAWYASNNDQASMLGETMPGGAINPGANSGIGGILAQMASQVQQSIAQLSNALMGTPSTTTAPTTATPTSAQTAANGGAATFANVSLGSTGDPHLSVSGTEQNADGSTTSVNSKFDSMTGHQDLFSTRDFGDGFHVSTSVTTPGANGITQNASATATMDGGRESVTMTNNGTISVTDHGQNVALTAGQTVTLSGGQNVSEGANGSVSISEANFGENLTTTFTANGGGGVDVTAQGQNVTLAGDLITGGTTPVAQTPTNVRRSFVTV
jgi:filamentous hemagglutinin